MWAGGGGGQIWLTYSVKEGLEWWQQLCSANYNSGTQFLQAENTIPISILWLHDTNAEINEFWGQWDGDQIIHLWSGWAIGNMGKSFIEARESMGNI